jgi:MFS transporter, PPP family, 3-phenylpropionic acid transporter
MDRSSNPPSERPTVAVDARGEAVETPRTARSARVRLLHVRALFATGGAATAALLPFYGLVLRDRGFPPEQIGLILAMSSLAGIVAAPVWSHVADVHLGSTATLQLSCAASAVAAIWLAMAGSRIALVIAAVALLGAASAPGTALVDAIGLVHLGADRVAEYGSIRLWASIGWAVAVVGFGLWFERDGVRLVPPVYAAGILAVAAVATRTSAARPAVARPGSRLGSVGEVFRAVPRLSPFLAGVLLVSIASWGTWSFVPIRITEGGGGPFFVGLGASVAAIVEIPIMRASGWLGERFALRALYVAGCAVYAVMMIGWAFAAGDPQLLTVILMARGAGFALVYVSLVVMTGRLVPARLRVTGQALLQIANTGIGPIAGAALAGFVYQRIGAAALFASAAAVVAIGATVVWLAMSDTGAARPQPRQSRAR